MRREDRRRHTKNLALASLLSALGVVLLYVGAVVEVLDMSMAMLASLPIVFAVIEMGGAWPWLMYAATGALSLILLPQKLPCVFYILLAGFYPILKEKIEGRVRGFIGYLLKFLVFGVSVSVMWLAIRIFLPATVFEGGVFFWIALIAVTLFLYDVLLTRLVSKYLLVWRKRFFKR